jgi:hypothetical protein
VQCLSVGVAPHSASSTRITGGAKQRRRDGKFFDPIELPDRTAMGAPLLVAEHGGPTMCARIGAIMRRVTIKLIRKMHNAA